MAASRARSEEPRSTVVSAGQVRAESSLLSIPTSATSSGTSSPAVAQRGENADREQVVGAEDRVGLHPLEQELGRATTRLDHEVARDLDQLLVARQPARAQPVEIAAPARRARTTVCVGPLTNAIRRAADRVKVANGLGGAPARIGPHRVHRGAPSAGRPITTTGAADALSSSACSWVTWRQAEDQPVDVAMPEVADHRELVVGVGAGRVEQQPDARDARDLLDRRDHAV